MSSSSIVQMAGRYQTEDQIATDGYGQGRRATDRPLVPGAPPAPALPPVSFPARATERERPGQQERGRARRRRQREGEGEGLAGQGRPALLVPELVPVCRRRQSPMKSPPTVPGSSSLTASVRSSCPWPSWPASDWVGGGSGGVSASGGGGPLGVVAGLVLLEFPPGGLLQVMMMTAARTLFTFTPPWGPTCSPARPAWPRAASPSRWVVRSLPDAVHSPRRRARAACRRGSSHPACRAPRGRSCCPRSWWLSRSCSGTCPPTAARPRPARRHTACRCRATQAGRARRGAGR